MSSIVYYDIYLWVNSCCQKSGSAWSPMTMSIPVSWYFFFASGFKSIPIILLSGPNQSFHILKEPPSKTPISNKVQFFLQITPEELDFCENQDIQTLRFKKSLCQTNHHHNYLQDKKISFIFSARNYLVKVKIYTQFLGSKGMRAG